MTVTSLVLWLVGLAALPAAIQVFRSVVTSRSWRMLTIGLLVPGSIAVVAFGVVYQGWIIALAVGVLFAVVILLSSAWRYFTTVYVEEQVRQRVNKVDTATQERMRARVSQFPFSFWRKRMLRFLERRDDRG